MGDDGTIQVNRGFRIQFNGAIGPYKVDFGSTRASMHRSSSSCVRADLQEQPDGLADGRW